MAFGAQTFSALGGAAQDLAAFEGTQVRGTFDIAEQQSYLAAEKLAYQNEQFTKTSTAIQEAQSDRELYMSMGRTTQEIAGAGLSLSGSALDILRESASQGALQKAVIGQQGLITEAGYKEQAQSYATMAQAAGQAAGAEKTAGYIDLAGAALSAGAAVATLAL